MEKGCGSWKNEREFCLFVSSQRFHFRTGHLFDSGAGATYDGIAFVRSFVRSLGVPAAVSRSVARLISPVGSARCVCVLRSVCRGSITGFSILVRVRPPAFTGDYGCGDAESWTSFALRVSPFFSIRFIFPFRLGKSILGRSRRFRMKGYPIPNDASVSPIPGRTAFTAFCSCLRHLPPSSI